MYFTGGSISADPFVAKSLYSTIFRGYDRVVRKVHLNAGNGIT